MPFAGGHKLTLPVASRSPTNRQSPWPHPTGTQHVPLQGSLAWPKPPRSPPRAKVPTVSQVQQQLRQNPAVREQLRAEVAGGLQAVTDPSDFNTLLMQAWQKIAGPVGPTPSTSDSQWPEKVQQLWKLRRRARRPTASPSRLGALFRQRVLRGRINVLQKQITKLSRERRKFALRDFLDSLEEAQAGGFMSRVFKAVQRFAPKSRRSTTQLKDEQGRLLDVEGADKVFQEYFEHLYQSPAIEPPALHLVSGLNITEAEWHTALAQTKSRKAVPRHFAPALIWRECADLLAAHLGRSATLAAGRVNYARSWLEAHLALLPKPPKPPCQPKFLRRIRYHSCSAT